MLLNFYTGADPQRRVTLPPISDVARMSLTNGGGPPPAAGATPNGPAAPVANGQPPGAPVAGGQHHEEPLPPGWEMRCDQYGRRYYVDHNTRFCVKTITPCTDIRPKTKKYFISSSLFI